MEDWINGEPVNIRNHDASSTKKLKNKEYEKELAKLHVELVKLQEWVKFKGLKVCIVFEGRDGAGKGGAIKAIDDPDLMIEFINAIELAEAALVRWLMEEKKAGVCHLWKHGAQSEEFQLAVERLRGILGELQ